MDRDEMKRPRTNDERISYKDGSDSERDVPSAPDTDTKRSVSMENTNRSLEDIIKDATERELDRFPKAELTPGALLAMERRHDRRKRKKILRIASIAAMFIIIAAGAVFVTGGYFDAGADKNPKEEIVTDDGIVSRDGGYGDQGGEDEFVLDSWDDVEGYKDNFEGIIIPEYMNDKYQFKEFSASEQKESFSYRFVFDYKSQEIELQEYYYIGKLGSFEMSNSDQTLKSKYGEIYIKKMDNNKKATIQIDDGYIIDLWSNLSNEEIVSIIESLDF